MFKRAFSQSNECGQNPNIIFFPEASAADCCCVKGYISTLRSEWTKEVDSNNIGNN